MAQPLQNKVEVNVIASVDGSDRIALRTGDSEEDVLMSLTPSQARLLATELIAAVNRAEVKANLKSGTNMWRRPGKPGPRLATAG
jgi:hypothetical protein